MAYGNYAEEMFLNWLQKYPEVTNITRDDDHKKTKSDRTFTYRGRTVTVQNKSIQTNSIRETAPGLFGAKIQNDASDARDITLSGGHIVHTTCYMVGEYEILAVPLQPFTGNWDTYAFKKNADLARSTDGRYTASEQRQLLATLVDITYPLDGTWTTDLFTLLR